MEHEIIRRLEAVRVNVPQMVLPHNRNISFTLGNSHDLTVESQFIFDQTKVG